MGQAGKKASNAQDRFIGSRLPGEVDCQVRIAVQGHKRRAQQRLLAVSLLNSIVETGHNTQTLACTPVTIPWSYRAAEAICMLF